MRVSWSVIGSSLALKILSMSCINPCRGDFEVHRSGKVPELCAGIQAHLSTCASPRVLDMVNKFVCRVPLTEVSRSSTWPTQFHDGGPMEDHIALYFFAKDVDR